MEVNIQAYTKGVTECAANTATEKWEADLDLGMWRGTKDGCFFEGEKFVGLCADIKKTEGTSQAGINAVKLYLWRFANMFCVHRVKSESFFKLSNDFSTRSARFIASI